MARARKAVKAARDKIARDEELSLDELINLVREATMSTVEASAHQVLKEAIDPRLPGLYRGKVRDNYDLPDGRRILVTSDRLSAFDRVLCCVPFKGQVLNGIA